MREDTRMNKFVGVLDLLAAPASKQRAFLEADNLPVDELALMFDDYFAPASYFAKELEGGGIRESLEEINRHLTEMGDVSGIWNYESLELAEEWMVVRRLARECAEVLAARLSP